MRAASDSQGAGRSTQKTCYDTYELRFINATEKAQRVVLRAAPSNMFGSSTQQPRRNTTRPTQSISHTHQAWLTLRSFFSSSSLACLTDGYQVSNLLRSVVARKDTFDEGHQSHDIRAVTKMS